MRYSTVFSFLLLVITGFLILTMPVSSAETYGDIMVKSDPTGAIVSIDGQTNTFQTPYQYYGIKTGRHIMKVKKPGYIVYTNEDVVVSPGMVTNIYAVLIKDPDYGSLRVSSMPEGADVYVDGVLRGKTPKNIGADFRVDTLYVTGLADGTHTVVLKLEGYEENFKTVETGTEKPGFIPVNVQLKPLASTPVRTPAQPALAPLPIQTPMTPSYGRLFVDSVPVGANILMNGTIQGVTPKYIEALPAGVYTISLQHSGYTPVTATAEVKPGQTTNQSYTLVPLPTTIATPVPTTIAETQHPTPIPTEESGSLFSLFSLVSGLVVLGIFLNRTRR